MGAIRVVRAGGGILVFPEGSRSPNGCLQPAKPGVGMIVAKTGAPVIPVRVYGSFEAFPIGAKKPKRNRITVVIGKPEMITIPLPSTKGDGYALIACKILDQIRSL